MFEEWGSLQKHKKTRLTGKPLAALNQKIYERDGGCCIICGAPIPEGNKAHHVNFGYGNKQDIEEELVMLCMDCHFKIHNDAKHMKEYDQFVHEYLNKMYLR